LNHRSIPSDPDLGRYLAEIKRYPMLDAETEIDLVRRWRKKRDGKALDRLVGSHLRLVVKVARSFRGYALPFAELISEGNLGLMQAIERFDPERGFRLSTYAIWWIRAQLQDLVVRSSSLVRMGTTASQKRIFFNLRRLAAKHEEIHGGDLSPGTVRKIAETLGVHEAEVVDMSRRMSGRDASLNETIDADGETERQDFLIDEDEGPELRLLNRDEQEKRHERLEAALDTLRPRERQILVERQLSETPKTLEDLGHHYGVSRERVRQIEARAVEKIGKVMRGDVTLPAA
jgi:RNA polymerase sigma-32 factor